MKCCVCGEGVVEVSSGLDPIPNSHMAGISIHRNSFKPPGKKPPDQVSLQLEVWNIRLIPMGGAELERLQM